MSSSVASRPIHSLLPHTVRRWLVDEPERASITVDGTIMSADISGFTRLTEALAHLGGRDSAEALIGTINRGFAPMIERIEANDGDVLKLGGDALFAVFPGSESALRASRSAAGCLADLEALNADLVTPLSMTVGLATGPVPLLLAGSGRRDLVVHGATVDECLRLETEAEPGEVLVSEATVRLLPDGWTEVIDDNLHLLDVAAVDGASSSNDSSPSDEATVDADGDEVFTAAIGPELTAAFDAFVDTIGEIRLVTVAFLDLPTRDLRDDVVAIAVQRLLDLCRQHGVTMLGSDVGLGGVKFMLAAGAPTAGDDDEDAMLRVLTKLVLDPDGPAMSAGANRGLTYAGFLGSDRIRTFTTMGDPTNLAARLMGKAEPRSVVVAQTVLDHCTAGWATTEMAPILVRGRHEPVVIHRLDGEQRADRRRADNRPRPTFVGRDRELAAANEAMAAARRGHGDVLDFRGRRGVGLSRLLDEIDENRPEGFVRFRIDARATSNSLPYADVGPILGSIVGIDEGLDDGARLDELAAWITRTAADNMDLLPLLAPMVGVEAAPTAASAAIEPEFRLTTAADLVASILGNGLTTPTIVLIDDIHRVDAASLSVLRALAVETAERPWVIVTTGRSGTEPLVAGREPLRLAPLTTQETVEMMAEVGPNLPDDRRADIAGRSAGNPFFAVALASSGDVAGSIEQLVTAQIDRLGHHPRVVLRTASVIGETFDSATLAGLLDTDEHDLDLGLADLDAMLDRVGERTYRFRAAVVREVAYAGLSNRRTAEVHRAVAALLEEREAAPADLARHHSRAGNHRAAIEHGRRAATEALRIGLMADATDHLLLVVEAIDRADLPVEESKPLLVEVLTQLYEVGVSAGRHAEAVAAGERAVGLIDDPTTRVKTLTWVASNRAEDQGSYESEFELLAAELEGLDGPEDAATASARAWLRESMAELKYRQGDMTEALALSEQARDEARQSGELRPLTSALLIRHMILGDRNAPEQHEAWEELMAAATELGDPKLMTFAYNNRGIDLQSSGDWSGAVDYYETAAAHAAGIGDRYRRLFPAINRAVLRCDQGHRHEARAELDRLRRDAAHDASGFTTAWAYRELGRLEAFDGNRDTARAHLDRARSWYADAGNVVAVHQVDLTLVAAELGVGRSQAVLDAVETVEEPDDPSPKVTGWADTSTGFALLQQDRADEAIDHFDRAVTATVDRYRFGEALALFGRSEAQRFAGRGRAARRTRAQSDEIFAELDVIALPYIPLPR